MENPEVSPREERNVDRVHPPVVLLMYKVMGNIRRPRHAHRRKQHPRDESPVRFRSLHHDGGIKHCEQVQIVNETRVHSAFIDSFELLGDSFLQRLVKSIFVVREEIIPWVEGISHKIFFQNLTGFGCYVVTLESFCDVSSLK